ncbi:MAG: type II toxin-antitoxin system RelE/ParE family toxin [Candidatus Gastranaerophilales bacterium]|nr:type II toxin-antitoxin system RelE/ParE family toxin [Candidatus Gastranaerophilales bacterium]
MKQFTAEYTDEAMEQYNKLDFKDQAKILEAISTFEQIGINYKNLNSLGNGLFEIKPKGVRAYFKYAENKIIIIGFITLKKTQKAPKRYIKQAITNIENYINKNKD